MNALAASIAGADRRLLVAWAMLLAAGLVAAMSASVHYAQINMGDPLHYARRQLCWLALSLLLAAGLMRVPMAWLARLAPWLALGSMALLVVVLVPGIGEAVNGSRRWLRAGPLSLQVAEFARIGLLVYMARYLARTQDALDWRSCQMPLVLLGLFVLALLAQPDFGTGMLLAGMCLVMMFVAGLPMRVFALLVIALAAAVTLLIFLEPYRWGRLTAFLNPWGAQFDGGYQLTQALIALGFGKWLGVGLGNSVQKLSYLPEAHTDFIFAIWAEETGALGSLLLLLCFAVLIWRMLAQALRAFDGGQPFGGYLACGAALLIGGQVIINIGMVVGLLPTKGMTLPFISYGGSSLLSCALLVAMVARLSSELGGGRGRRVQAA